jgi:hypothetical protein
MTPGSTDSSSERASRRGALPNLIVIGAHKCGTSSLHYYLGLHPEIQMSSPKELRFFCEQAVSTGQEEQWRWHARGNWSRGVEWYADHFDPAVPIRGESSPPYTAPFFPGSAERMASVVPGARLVYIVRDPIERMLSAWAHYRAAGLERRGIEEALSQPGNTYLERSRYHTRLLPYLERFPQDRILILASEDLRDRRRETMAEVFAFLGVDPDFWSPRMGRARNVGAGRGHRRRLLDRLARSRLGERVARALPQELKWHLERGVSSSSPSAGTPSIGEPLRLQLGEELAGEVERLSSLAGREFTGWRIS